ncbi:MAG: TetR/AcrR family transcriptional regulator [Gallionellaceae bacterium]
MTVTPALPTKERLLETGARLFAEKGFAGVSARKICSQAGTTSNMVHHFFGSKQGLLSAIAEQLSIAIFAIPIRLLKTPPVSKEEFASRMQMLFETTLEAYIEHRDLLLVVVREDIDTQGVLDYTKAFAEFLERAKREGFVRKQLDSEITTGAIIDRILNQVSFAPQIKRVHGLDIISDGDYRQRWCKLNLDLFLNGMTTR